MLWIWYCPGTDEQIRVACQAAKDVLTEAGYSPHMAQQATFDAAELEEDFSGEGTPNADAVVAWYKAEAAAFESIHSQTGEWPHSATLILTMQEGG
jgi:hypothetical protein